MPRLSIPAPGVSLRDAVGPKTAEENAHLSRFVIHHFMSVARTRRLLGTWFRCNKESAQCNGYRKRFGEFHPSTQYQGLTDHQGADYGKEKAVAVGDLLIYEYGQHKISLR
jgi:hypothetical protein